MIYLLYGEDDYLKKEFLNKIRKNFEELKLGINYIQIDENNISELISDIETPAFGYPTKLIEVRNSGLFKKKNQLAESISQYLSENNTDTVELVFIEDEDVEKNELYNLISKVGTVKDFQEKKMPELIAKVKSISNAYHVNIMENTAQYFIECCGTNMQDIINELRKLIEYAGNGGTITKEDIDSLTNKKSDSIIFDLTDNLGRKNIKKAIDVLHDLTYAREPLQRILIMLYGHFKKLYIVKISDPRQVAQNLKLKPNQVFLINKYSMQAKYFTENELSKILEEFIYIDEASKNGSLDIGVGIESVLCKYCS